MERSSIQVSPRLRIRLEQRKSHPRQSYEEVILCALDATEIRAPARLETPPVAQPRALAIAAAKSRLVTRYGDRLSRVLLFGSTARGEARADSDVDLLVVLKGDVEPGREIDALVDDELELEEEFGVPVSIVPMAEGRFLTESSPLLMNVRREGIPI